MKEAASEANLTVVAIILIGVIAGIATTIVTNMMNNTKIKTECMSEGFSKESELNACIQQKKAQ